MHENDTIGAESSNRDKKNKITNPSTLVQEFQLALFKRIKEYGGGISGVWKAIDPNLKKSSVDLAEKTGKKESLDRINRDAFRKAVERLEEETPHNEHMQFGIHCNILLMMNIFEILGINNIKDLTETEFQKPDIASLIMESNIIAQNTIIEFNKLNDKINFSMMNKPRISNLKVCQDWEQILNKMIFVINLASENHANISQDSIIVKNYINLFDIDTQIALHSFLILNQYKEYFYQNRILHQFIKRLEKLHNQSYNNKNKLIIIAPLYLLYFFLLLQKRFINIFINDKKISSAIEFTPFRYTKNVKLAKNINDSNEDLKLTKYILEENNNMLNSTKKILENFDRNLYEITSLQNTNPKILLCDIIGFFTKIYITQVSYDASYLAEFMKDISNLNELYAKLSLWKPVLFYFTEDDKNIMEDWNQKLEIYYSDLVRNG
jgi:hypothetical protein